MKNSTLVSFVNGKGVAMAVGFQTTSGSLYFVNRAVSPAVQKRA